MKSNDYEYDQRVEQVRKWLCECTPRMDIARMGIDKWGVSLGMIDKYIAEANVFLKTLTIESAQESLAMQIKRHEHLLKEAYRDGDKRTVSATLKQLDYLKGLGKTNLDVTTNGEPINKIIVEIITKPLDESGNK